MMLQFMGLWLWSLNQHMATQATVGLGINCRYHPTELQQALLENRLVFVTNEFTITGLQIKKEGVHLIGGYNNCDDIYSDSKGQNRTKISGAGETVALQINAQANGSVILENFEIFDGLSKQAGGIEIVNVKRFKLTHSLVYGNVSEGSGGGIHLSGDGIDVEIMDTKIFNNSARNTGGGVAISGQYNLIKFYDSIVIANQAGYAGGGISCQNPNQINVFLSKNMVGSWIEANHSQLASNSYYDLKCQIQLTSNGHVGFNGL